MAKKNITINDLAIMVQKGFTGVDLKFEQVEKSFGKIEKDLTIIKGQLADVVHHSEFDKLESRVEYLENVLNLPSKKH